MSDHRGIFLWNYNFPTWICRLCVRHNLNRYRTYPINILYWQTTVTSLKLWPKFTISVWFLIPWLVPPYHTHTPPHSWLVFSSCTHSHLVLLLLVFNQNLRFNWVSCITHFQQNNVKIYSPIKNFIFNQIIHTKYMLSLNYMPQSF